MIKQTQIYIEKKVRNLDKKLTLNTCLLMISTSNHSPKNIQQHRQRDEEPAA
jgi:hypothetical protein